MEPRQYILELHHPTTDALISHLRDAYDIPYSEVLNGAPTLEFKLPIEVGGVSDDVVKPNEIWLRNYETGVLVRRFRITGRRDIREQSMRLAVVITAEGFLNQLADEHLLIDYAVEDKHIVSVISDLLQKQAVTPAITQGVIDPDVTRSLNLVEGDTLLRAINRLHATVECYIDVDNDKALQWLNDIGEDTGQQIRYRKNLKGIERETDYTPIVNRLSASGAGSGIDRIELATKQLEYDDETFTIIRGSEDAPEVQTDNNTSIYLGEAEGYAARAGVKVTVANRVITSLSFLLSKADVGVGYRNHGPVYFRIRKTSDDEIIVGGTLGSSGGIVTWPDKAWYTVTFDEPVNINEEVRLLCEFYEGGGEVPHRLYCYYQSTDVKANEVFTYYDGGYTDEATDDATYKYTYTSGSATIRSCGQKLTVSNKAVYKLMFPLKKVGDPTGPVVFDMATVAEGSCIGHEILCDASELSADEWTWYSVAFRPEYITNTNEEVRAYVSFHGGDNSNYIIMPRTTSSVVADECYTTYSISAGWVDNTDYDSPYIYAWVLEDATSQAAWGVHCKPLSNTDMTDFDGLLAWAELELARLKDPRIAYRIDTVDLSAHGEIDFSFEALQLGSQITVIDEELDISVKLRVVKITHSDLLHPEQMVIEVANKVRDITDTLTALEAA